MVTAPEMDHVGQREWRPLTVDVRLASRAEATVWSPQERIELRAGRESGVRLSLDGPELDYVVRFIAPAVGSVRASGGATVSGEHGARFFAQPTCHHRPEVVGGIEERESGEILKAFFKERR